MDLQRSESRIDFLECLDTDAALHIMSFLTDPIDLVRAGAVSRIWHQFVVTRGLAKALCLRAFPQLLNVGNVIVNPGMPGPAQVRIDAERDWGTLLRDQKVYASLLHALTKSRVPPKDCITTAVSASSTDNYPDESIANTLSSSDRYINRPSYWSSAGQINPDVPETLIYKLRPGFWVIYDIDVQPFQAFFQPGNLVYSARSVRFRLGRPKPDVGTDFRRLPLQEPADDKFIWTYTSPEFPMTQENRLQSFRLPEPVLCVNGFLQVELLGRVQRHDANGLFFICVCHSRALGRPLFPAFELEIPEPNGMMMLKYNPNHLKTVVEKPPICELRRLRKPLRRRIWWQLLNADMGVIDPALDNMLVPADDPPDMLAFLGNTAVGVNPRNEYIDHLIG